MVFVVLAVPVAYNSGLFSIPELSFDSPTTSHSQPDSAATVFVDPNTIVKGYRIGDKFQVHVNVSTVTDLYTWNINITWLPAILNFTKIVSYGDFLAQTNSPHGTSRIVNMVNVNNEAGTAVVAESVLGEYPGISGKGRLVTIEFIVANYGWTNLTVSVAGNMPTELLNSTGGNIPFTATSGFFRNVGLGDVNGDRVVNLLDAILLSVNFGRADDFPSGDIDGNGAIDVLDALIIVNNWGLSW